MGKKLPPRQLELYQAIDEILWRDWDPIGVFGIDGARDEYQMYLPQVYQLALEGDRAKIADYLFCGGHGKDGPYYAAEPAFGRDGEDPRC
jgi:hypothetical protein